VQTVRQLRLNAAPANIETRDSTHPRPVEVAQFACARSNICEKIAFRATA